LNNGRKIEKLYAILKIVNNINPNKSGSVGKAISVLAISAPKSIKDIDKGVKKTTRKNKYLKLNIDKYITAKNKGMDKSKKFSCDTQYISIHI
tara:strand:- start:1411 stop:1689 length:279 start_codon:yes stop_codon:yes gene_type:complete